MNDGIKETCGNCNKYGDLHSSCGKVRDMSVDSNTFACENFRKKPRYSILEECEDMLKENKNEP